MLPIYLGALGFGGTLVIVSLLVGAGHHGIDHHVDGHGHAGLSAAAFGWLPVTSLRFWTFFLCFGGLAGTALTYSNELVEPVVGVASAAVGWFAGVAVVATMKRAEKGTGSAITRKDLEGEVGNVLVAVAPGQFGKIRVSVKGQIVDLAAETVDEGKSFAPGTKVMIVGESENGRVQVTAA